MVRAIVAGSTAQIIVNLVIGLNGVRVLSHKLLNGSIKDFIVVVVLVDGEVEAVVVIVGVVVLGLIILKWAAGGLILEL